MSLKDIVNNAPRTQSFGFLPGNNSGVAVLKNDNGKSVVFDRDERDFVRSKRPYILGRSKSRLQRSGFLGRLKDAYESVVDFVAEGYQHGKDLVDIARKHGVKTALQYEGEVFKQDFRNAKFAIQLSYAMMIDGMRADNARYGELLSPQHAVVQVDNPRVPESKVYRLDVYDRIWTTPFDPNRVYCNNENNILGICDNFPLLKGRLDISFKPKDLKNNNPQGE